MLLISCIVLLSSTLSISSPVKNCTETEGPCWCQHDMIFLKSHCEDVNSGIKLQNDPSEIELEDDEVEKLRSGTFKGLCIKKLTLQLPRLQYVDDTVFYDLKDCLISLLLLDGKLSEVPINALKSLVNLRILSLSGQEMKYIASFQLLPLEHLVLGFNKISLINKDAFPLTLKVLTLNNNQLKTLNESLLQLEELYWLFISNNKLSSLSGELDGLKSLELLIVANNNIEDLTDSLGNLKKLTDLDLSNNRIRKLKNDLYGLHSLRKLNLSHNMIQNLLGKEFVGLNNLEHLDLSYNYLEGVADSFRYLRKLKDLMLAGNNLHVLDRSFHCLNRLQFIDLSKNYLSDLDWLIEDGNSYHNCIFRNHNALKWLFVTENLLDCYAMRKINSTINHYRIRIFGAPSC